MIDTLRCVAAKSALVLAGFASFAVSGAALAQGQISVPTRDELEGITRQQAPERPRLSISGGIERSPCALNDEDYADVRVTVRNVTFNGLKGATPAELAPSWEPFVGRELPVSVLCEIRDGAATILRNKGYLAATLIPTQRIEDGEIVLEVLYGRITEIRARGETRGAETKLRQYLGRLADEELFDRNQAERYLLLARDLPGYNVNLTLRPADGPPGSLAGEITVLRQPYAATFTLQNLGSESTGPFGGQVSVQAFGLTGMGDATSLSYFASADFNEQHVLQASHEFRPGGEGLVVAGQFTYAWTAPDIGLANTLAPGQDLKAETLFASLSATYPLKRSQAVSTYLGAGFDYVDQDVEFLVPLARDRIRVGWIKFQHDAIDTARRAPRYQTSFTLELRQGLDIFGASTPCIGAGCPAGFVSPGRVDGDPEATIIKASGVAEFKLTSDAALTLKPRGQIASGALLGFEEFSAGNYTVGRGYEPGAIIGDDGLGLSTELRTISYDLSESLAVTAQPYIFFDAAKVWNRGGQGSDELFSAGAGARMTLGNRFNLDAVLAIPLSDTPFRNQRGKVRLLFTLSTRLLPWRS